MSHGLLRFYFANVTYEANDKSSFSKYDSHTRLVGLLQLTNTR